MKDRDPSLYLTHVLESIELARVYLEGVDFRRFSESQQLQDAVIRRTTLSLFVNPRASVPVPADFQEGFATLTLGADGGDGHIWTRRD